MDTSYKNNPNIEYSNSVPTQTVPYSKKTEDWRKACVTSYINLSQFYYSSSHKAYLKKLYDAYNGVINQYDYTYVTRPYGRELKNFPSKMKDYPIIRPVVDCLLGEYTRRPKSYMVSVDNSDAIDLSNEVLHQKIYKSLEQKFINTLNEAGVDTGVQSQPTESPEEIAKKHLKEYKDTRAIQGQTYLKYVNQYCRIPQKWEKAFLDWLVTGEVYTYRGVNYNEPEYEVINPLEIDYDKDPNLDFVEDGDWVVSRKQCHASTVVDAYYDELTKEEIIRLEKPRNTAGLQFNLFQNTSSFFEPSYRHPDRLTEVCHVCWKSRKQIGFLTYIDEFGQEQIMEVDPELVKPDKSLGQSMRTEWVNEVWEGTRIDGDIFVRMRPMPVQRNSMDNPSKCKLPYNGRIFSNRNSANVSMVSLGMVYQMNYNIIKYRLDLSVAKAKDMIGMLDLAYIPKKWDMDKYMYYIDATGIAWYDSAAPDFKPSPNMKNYLDLTNKSITQYVQLLDFILSEWERVSGVTRQRMGETKASDLASVTQQAVYGSSMVTETYFSKFEEIEQLDTQAMLDFGKYVCANGKKTMFIMPDGTTSYLDIDGPEFASAEMSVFVTKSGKEKEKFEFLKQMAPQLIQNGVPMSVIAGIMDSDNFTTLVRKIEAAEALMAQQKEAEAAMQQEIVDKNNAAAKELQDAAIQNENMNNQLDREKDIYVAEIKALGTQAINTPDADNNGQPDIIESGKLALEQMKLNFETTFKNKELSQKDRELDFKEKELKDWKEVEEKKIKASKNKPKTK